MPSSPRHQNEANQDPQPASHHSPLSKQCFNSVWQRPTVSLHLRDMHSQQDISVTSCISSSHISSCFSVSWGYVCISMRYICTWKHTVWLAICRLHSDTKGNATDPTERGTYKRIFRANSLKSRQPISIPKYTNYQRWLYQSQQPNSLHFTMSNYLNTYTNYQRWLYQSQQAIIHCTSLCPIIACRWETQRKGHRERSRKTPRQTWERHRQRESDKDTERQTQRQRDTQWERHRESWMDD